MYKKNERKARVWEIGADGDGETGRRQIIQNLRGYRVRCSDFIHVSLSHH